MSTKWWHKIGIYFKLKQAVRFLTFSMILSFGPSTVGSKMGPHTLDHG